jgi:outer membrane protein OmpA-like peptidoglycan-associated protein
VGDTFVRPKHLVPLAALLLAAPLVAVAEPTPQYSSDQFVTAILAGPMPCPAGKSQAACEANPRTRRWTLAPAAAPVAAPIASGGVSHAGYLARGGRTRPAAQRANSAAAAEVCAKVTAQDLCVTFRINSNEITPQGRANLSAAAAGLKADSLTTLDFEVAGYTDASGAAARNLELSNQRADAVKAFLVQQGVAANRLKIAGYGSEHLAVPTDPTSAQNRRVELHRLN